MFFCQVTGVMAAENPPFSVSLGFDFASGDYGTTQTTDSYSLALNVSYFPDDRFDFYLEIPYLYQSNSSTVSLGGMRVPMQTSSGTSTSGMGGGGGTSSTTTSQSGPGDISLTTGYILITEMTARPMIRPLVYLKIPTADKDKGLGTGAFDAGAGLSIAKGFNAWTLYAETLYILPGSSADYKPDNYWTYLGSIHYQLSRRTGYGVAVSGSTAAFSGNDDALEVRLKTDYQLSETQSIGAYVGKGLSDSSADFAAGFYGAINF
jgi:hypothetical protein